MTIIIITLLQDGVVSLCRSDIQNDRYSVPVSISRRGNNIIYVIIILYTAIDSAYKIDPDYL